MVQLQHERITGQPYHSTDYDKSKTTGKCVMFQVLGLRDNK